MEHSLSLLLHVPNEPNPSNRIFNNIDRWWRFSSQSDDKTLFSQGGSCLDATVCSINLHSFWVGQKQLR